MKNNNFNNGFSLIEILVSLFVVCLAAVNIVGLQKMVNEQNRDNFYHSAALTIVEQYFETFLQSGSESDLVTVIDSSLSEENQSPIFTLLWGYSGLTYGLTKITLTVSWTDTSGSSQSITYSNIMSESLFLENVNGGIDHLIANSLNTNQVSYFDTTTVCKEDGYVIYDSQLFQATADHYTEHIAPINSEGVVSSGWELKGDVNDESLASLFVNE